MSRKEFSIRLLISAHNQSSLVFQSIEKEILFRIYEFSGNTQMKLESYLEEFHNSTSSNLEDNIVEKQEEKVSDMFNSLLKLFRFGVGDNFTKTNSLEVENLSSLEFVEFFYSLTNYNKDCDMEVIEIEKGLIDNIEVKITKTVDEILKLDALKIVKEALLFDEVFNYRNKLEVEKCADACWELYTINSEITVNEIISRVKSEFRIKKYYGLNSSDKKKKISATVKQWVRDVKKEKNIIIKS